MKQRSSFFSRINLMVFILFSVIVFGISVYSIFIIRDLREKEAGRMTVFAAAMKFLQDEDQGDPRMLELVQQIIISNDNIPIIVTDTQGIPIPDYIRNIPDNVKSNPQKLQERLQSMKKSYPPIKLQISNKNTQYLYFDNSDLMNNLRYYPFVLGLFVLSYLLFSFWFLRTIKKTDEGYLWAGLAKETAHQIGTPLSSMIGWIEILKMDCENHEGVLEMEKDIQRLTTISERFSKIGSVAEVNEKNLCETLDLNYHYLKSRISKKVDFQLHLPNSRVYVPHNRILINWAIENLVKNAVDAMKGEGTLTIVLTVKGKQAVIDITDSGSGMSARNARMIFKPGYSTKKRGWGLGLSLAKRAVSEYHKGEIKVWHTEIGKGTTFRIILKPLIDKF